jgi:hypothetical protein
VAGYRIAYITPAGIEYPLNDNAHSFLQRKGMVGFDPMEVEVPTYRRPGRDGGYTSGRPYTAERDFGVLTDVIGATHEQVASAIAATTHAVNPYEDEDTSGAVRVYTPDGRIRQIDARPSALPVSFNGTVGVGLGHRFHAPYPFFYDPTQQVQTFALSTPGGLSFPITFPIEFGTTLIDSRLTVSNDGEVATWPTVTIYGPGTDPVIENETTGLYLDLTNDGTFTLDSGDYVVINMDAATILHYDASENTSTYVPQRRTTLSHFWSLLPRDNAVHVTMNTVTTGSVRLVFYEYFRGGY